MNKRDLHPELRQAYRFVPSLPIHRPWVHGLVSLLQRLLPRRIKPAPGVAIEDRALSEGAVRVYRPEQGACGAGLLWIHGGGYIMGDAAINDRECSALARDLGLVVVSVEYRLAPRHPFPAALDDCYEAWEWYLGQSPGRDTAPPYAVPARREDLSGLPPAWIGVGKLDLFYREDCAYAERLQAAGVPCDLHVTPRAPHGYDLLAPDAPVSRAFIHDYYRFLSQRLEAGVEADRGG